VSPPKTNGWRRVVPTGLYLECARLIAFAAFSGFVVLVLDLLAGAGFEGGDHGADDVFAEFEYCGLILAVSVFPSDGEVVFSMLHEEERRSSDNADEADGDGWAITAAGFLAVLERFDLRIRNLDPVVAGSSEDENFIVIGGRSADSSLGNSDGAPDVHRFLSRQGIGKGELGEKGDGEE
jgi:hypothetical protein